MLLTCHPLPFQLSLAKHPKRSPGSTEVSGKAAADFAGATTSTLVSFSGTPARAEKKGQEIKQWSKKNQRIGQLYTGKK